MDWEHLGVSRKHAKQAKIVQNRLGGSRGSSLTTETCPRTSGSPKEALGVSHGTGVHSKSGRRGLADKGHLHGEQKRNSWKEFRGRCRYWNTVSLGKHPENCTARAPKLHSACCRVNLATMVITAAVLHCKTVALLGELCRKVGRRACACRYWSLHTT